MQDAIEKRTNAAALLSTSQPKKKIKAELTSLIIRETLI
jgi:hypothetical protein